MCTLEIRGVPSRPDLEERSPSSGFRNGAARPALRRIREARPARPRRVETRPRGRGKTVGISGLALPAKSQPGGSLGDVRSHRRQFDARCPIRPQSSELAAGRRQANLPPGARSHRREESAGVGPSGSACGGPSAGAVRESRRTAARNGWIAPCLTTISKVWTRAYAVHGSSLLTTLEERMHADRLCCVRARARLGELWKCQERVVTRPRNCPAPARVSIPLFT